MLGPIVTVSIITALVFYVARQFRSQGSPFLFERAGWFEEYVEAGDLPCPWCQAPTQEADQACPSCERVFGLPVSG